MGTTHAGLEPDGTPFYEPDWCHRTHPFDGSEWWCWSNADYGWSIYESDPGDGPEVWLPWTYDQWHVPSEPWHFGFTLVPGPSGRAWMDLSFPVARAPPKGYHYSMISNNAPRDGWKGSVWIAVSDYKTGRWDWWRVSNWSFGRLARPISKDLKLGGPSTGYLHVLIMVDSPTSYAMIGNEWTLQTAPD